MLNLPGLRQVGHTEADDHYIIEAVTDDYLPKCDCGNPRLVSNGRKAVEFVDTPMHDKRVTLRVQRQRYLCRNCGETDYADIPHVIEAHRLTERCFAYITKNGARRTWTMIANDLGMDPQTVANIWNKWADAALAKIKMATPRWMGIDELFIMGQYRAVITNIEQKALVNMLPNRDIGTLHAYFTSASFDPKEVQCVTIDMHRAYRDVVREVFPNAKLIVDRYHVSRMAVAALEDVRKSIRHNMSKRQRINMLGDRYLLLTNRENLPPLRALKLETVLEQYPQIRPAYELKESFREIWKCKTRAEAEAAYDLWEMQAKTGEVEPFFRPLCKAVANWREEIFSFIDTQLTNAYTESFNALARRNDWGGHGYSFETLRKRLIIAHGLQFRVTPKTLFSFGRKGPPVDMNAMLRRMYPVAEREVIGCPLSTLAKVAGKVPLD